MKKKRKKYNDLNASAKSNDTFGTIFESMIENKKFQKLNIATRVFYVYCRIQAHTKQSNKIVYTKMKENNTQYDLNDCFVFPAKHLKAFNVKRSNASVYFKELEQSGFIKKIEKNNQKQKINVYCFTNEWKNATRS